jgi:ATP-grasp domain, R2K clade family 3
MSSLDIKPENLDLILIEDVVWVVKAKVGVPIYDFEFENLFACRHPFYSPEKIKAIGRFGVSTNYKELFIKLQNDGIELIHTPEQYLLASDLTHWYQLLSEYTPKSIWFDNPPDAKVIEKDFEYPIFIKGSRQTSRHKATLSIINSPKEYNNCVEEFKHNPILHWQKFVVREFVKLRKVDGIQTEKIPPSFEFRTFWWKGELVGAGSYWKDFASYNWTDFEKAKALILAKKAVKKLNLPFVVIDLAQTLYGDWIIIECNDGQESGYATISPISLWQKIIDIEKNGKLNDY